MKIAEHLNKDSDSQTLKGNNVYNFQLLIFFVLVAVIRSTAADSFCESCHKEITPEIVQSFNQGRMADGLTCMDCHGKQHNSSDNADLAQIPDASTCDNCHGEQVAHHREGKHNRDLAGLPEALLNYHTQTPKEDCASCHRDSRSTQHPDFGSADFSCLTCHQPHTFLTAKTKRPQTCKTCHGFEKSGAWQAWAGSPHGRLYFSKPDSGKQAPYCQTCHMEDGEHRMESRWGAWDVNLVLPEGQWQKNQQTIRRALFGDLQSAQLVLVSDSIRTKRMRIRYRQVCLSCHGEDFVRKERRKAENILMQADGLMSTAIAMTAHMQGNIKGLLLPAASAGHEPRLTGILQTMFYQHRRQLYRAVLHVNYDLAAKALQQMKNDLTQIKRFVRRPQ